MAAFNRAYCAVLHLLDKCFNGSPRLLSVATGEMYALKHQAIELMELPSGDGQTMVGPSFEYVPSELRHRPNGERRVVVMPNGPYLVYGDIPLVRKRKVVAENGESLAWEKTETILTEETYALCRCGESGSKPFCDGRSHARVGFDGSEAHDSRVAEERQLVHEGNGIVVRRDLSLCMHARFCVGRLRKIPEMMEATSDSDMRAHIIGLIEHCPSGTLTRWKRTGRSLSPTCRSRSRSPVRRNRWRGRSGSPAVFLLFAPMVSRSGHAIESRSVAADTRTRSRSAMAPTSKRFSATTTSGNRFRQARPANSLVRRRGAGYGHAPRRSGTPQM
jgi:CDGSH-type Zn-finger protein